MNQLFINLLSFFERNAFGVCDWWGDKLHIPTRRIRLFFIYGSFMTIGSPVIFYFIMAFVLNIRKYVKERRDSVWDL